MPTQGIIFVRIEGVLASARALAAAREVNLRSLLDPVALGLLARLCRETGGAVILAGTLYGRLPAKGSDWQEFFDSVGFSIPVIDVISEQEGQLDCYEAPYLKRWFDLDKPSHVVLDCNPAPPPGNLLRWRQVDRLVGLSLCEAIHVLETLSPQNRDVVQLRLIAADKLTWAG